MTPPRTDGIRGEMTSDEKVHDSMVAPDLIPGRWMTTGATVRTTLIVLGIVGGAIALVRLHELVIVFVIGIVLAEGLRPAVAAIQRRGASLHVARLCVYGVVIGLFVLTAAVLSRPVAIEARAVLTALPDYQAELQRSLDQLPLEAGISTTISGSAAGLAKAAFSLAAGLARGVLYAVVVILISFLWLSASQLLGAFVHGLLPPSQRRLAADIWAEVAAGFAGYVRGVVLNMIVIGVLTGVAAALLGLPAPALLGVLAGVTEMIPIVGPVIGAVPAVLLGLTISPTLALVVAVVYLAIQQIEAHTLVPIVMKHAVGLPALAVVLALAVGATLGGVGGALVAVPVAFALQVIIVRGVAPAIRRAHSATRSPQSSPNEAPTTVAAD